MLLVSQVAGLVPFLAVLASAPQVRHHIYTTDIKPDPARGVEVRGAAHAVTAVASEQSRVLPIELETFLSQDVQRDFRPIPRGHEFPHYFQVPKIDRGSHRERGASGLGGGWIEGEPG